MGVNVPAVSVVVPFLDPPLPFFREAIESVQAQTFTDWELVLVDDGSGAEARALAEASAGGDERIRIVGSPAPRPAGISRARNAGIRASRGDVIAMLDADDVYEPDRLVRHLAALEAAPEAGLVFGDTVYWSSWRAGVGLEADVVPAFDVEPGLVPPPNLLVSILEGRGASPCVCSLTVRRAVLEACGGFEAAFPGVYEDQVFLAKVCGARPVLYLPEALDRYRLHQHSLTAGTSAPGGAAARTRFLAWLEDFAAEGLPAPVRRRVEAGLRRARWEVRHPVLAGIRRRLRKWYR